MTLSPLYRSITPLGKSAGGVTAFSPASIAGLKLWIDFSDITTLYQDAAKTTPVASDGDVIGCAADKSGNVYDAKQTVTASKPSYKVNTQNGKSIGRFAADHLLGNIAVSVSSFTYFIIAKQGTGAQYIFEPDKTNGDRHAVITGFGGIKFEHYNTPRFTYNNTNTGMVLLALTRNATGNALVGYYNANSIYTGSSTFDLTPGADYVIGANKNSAVPYSGDIAELIIYDSVLSAGNLAAINSYLNTKWAVY